jgi:hypothetical protein
MDKYGDIIYVETPYRPEPGSFCMSKSNDGIRHKVRGWHYCRDIFNGQLYNLKLFFFSHELNMGQSVFDFMSKVENILDVQPRSHFGPTQRNTIMWVRPSRWWTIKAMRRSLFTILLRAGSNYNIDLDNFEEALYSNQYSLNTKYAVERFLAGNTLYVGKKRGWYKQFHETIVTPEQIDLLLVEPK